MHRTIELAKLGWGKTRPNPLVGAVIVKDDNIVSEGYHHYFGGDHAEVDALKKINFNAEGATIYVNLEPCSHHGKTPPCVDAIIRSKIKRVVVGTLDPNPKVAGRGISILRNNGIEVITGILEPEAIELNEVFIKYITTSTPFCILKTAMTLDGKLATVNGDSKWITNEESRGYVHKLRDRMAGIMVGITTIIKDNPQLNTRIPGKEANQPTRIIVDSSCRIPMDSIVVQTAKTQPTLIATTEKAVKTKIQELQEKGVKVLVLPSVAGKVPLKQLMSELGKMEIDSVLLEGGGSLNFSALEEGVVDKVMTFIAPKIIGGKDAITPVEGAGKKTMKEALQLSNIKVTNFHDDILIEGYIEGKD